MKAKDQIRLNTIRLIRAEFANAQIQHQVDQLSDEQAQAVLRKMSKMRADSIKMYSDNGATERAEAERAERPSILVLGPGQSPRARLVIWLSRHDWHCDCSTLPSIATLAFAVLRTGCLRVFCSLALVEKMSWILGRVPFCFQNSAATCE
ncbi:hypothetical protein MPSEU_001057400 [Mayamaea pseudoterrestris]|nr:hypothetical protein MPSEU_001057400 [Mayamaea pseudoterrestris]